MTKKIIIALIGILSATGLKAQNVYVCDGFSYDAIPVSSVKDMLFSTASGSSLKITSTDGTTYAYDTDDIDSLTFEEPQFPAVSIVYNGTTASVTIASNVKGVTCSSGTSSHVVLTSTNTDTEYLYTVSGTSTNGSLTVNGDYKLSLQLAGVDLTSQKGAAIDIECGKRIDLILKNGTTNSLADYASGDQKAALYAKGHVEVKGAGTLNVKGNCKHAISAKEYFLVKASAGTINITGAVSDGIHCGKGEKGSDQNYFQMNGGTINISGCGSDGIDSDDYGCAKLKGGTLSLDVAATGGNGLKCDSILTLSGTDVNINVSGNTAEGIRSVFLGNYNGGTVKGTVSGDGARGIRAKKSSDVITTGGGNAEFAGTDVTLTVTGTTYTIDGTKCMGIKVDATLHQTAGKLDITVNSTDSKTTALSAKTDNKEGGTRTF